MNILINKILEKISPHIKTIPSNLPDADKKLITNIRTRHLSYLSVNRLASIAQTCRNIESRSLPGIMLEAGCALGGSSILIASIKKNTRSLYIYDVFGMIPPPTRKDGLDVLKRFEVIRSGKSKGLGGKKYYGYEKNLQKIVLNNLAEFGINIDDRNVSLIKGLLQTTMKIDQPVSFAHIDVDWYEPVKASLERIIPNLVIGGSVILDDYNDWSGCHKATDEYFQEISPQFSFDDSSGSLKITRMQLD